MSSAENFTQSSKGSIFLKNGHFISQEKNTVDSRYLEFQGTHWNTSRYPYLDISELRE